MVDLRDETEVAHHGIGEDLVERVDRTDRYVRLAQAADDLVLRQLPYTPLELRDERLTVLHARAVVGEPLVFEELFEVERAAETLEERVVPAADVHEAVGRAERLVRDDRAVHVPLGRGDRPVGEIARGLP